MSSSQNFRPRTAHSPNKYLSSAFGRGPSDGFAALISPDRTFRPTPQYTAASRSQFYVVSRAGLMLSEAPTVADLAESSSAGRLGCVWVSAAAGLQACVMLRSCRLVLLGRGCCRALCRRPRDPFHRRPLPDTEPRRQHLQQTHELQAATEGTWHSCGCENRSIGQHPRTNRHLFRETQRAWHRRICLRPHRDQTLIISKQTKKRSQGCSQLLIVDIPLQGQDFVFLGEAPCPCAPSRCSNSRAPLFIKSPKWCIDAGVKAGVSEICRIQSHYDRVEHGA